MDLIQFKQGSSTLVLQGAKMAASVRGAVLWADGKVSSKEELICSTVYEDLRITLQGTTAEIEAALGVIAKWLEEAARVAQIPGMEWVYLEVRLLPTGVIWRSRILGGCMETMGAGAEQRATKNQGVRLFLERMNYWEDNAERELKITPDINAAPVTGGITISNHWDGLHSNFAHLAAANAGGDIPAPLRLAFVSALAEMGRVYVGENISSEPASVYISLEAEDGDPGSAMTYTKFENVATASTSAYGRFTWTGANEVIVLSLALDGTLLQKLGGMPFLPVMRLHSQIAGGDKLWARWRVGYQNQSSVDNLAETQAAYLVNADALQPGGPICLPPWKVEAGEQVYRLEFQLIVQADAGGSHTLDIDYVFLLPLEYWRIYRENASQAPGCLIYDNPYSGTVKGYGLICTHNAEGPGLWVWPGKDQRFYFLIEGVSAGGSPISTASTIRMYYRPRKKAL